MSKKSAKVSPLLEEFFTEYLPHVKGVQENTIISYQYAFQLLFRYLEEKKGLTNPEKVTFNDLGDKTIEEFLFYLEQERGCSVRTRNLRRAAIVTFAKFASKRAFSISLPFYNEAVNLPKKRVPKNSGFKHFTKEEIAIMLKLPKASRIIGQRDITILSLLYATGSRAQELCDITLGAITFGSPTKIRLTGKGPKTRMVTIPDTCTAILKEYLQSRNFDVNSPETRHRHLFSSQTNEHMSISCVEEIVKKYVKEAKKLHPELFKEDNYTPHSFRHSIAVHMLEAGESLVAIKAFLGHSSIESTAIYAQVTP
ncbi:MAG: site-specific integrase, partial [Oscillospiraceae bacterium]|nr:site-specific integrase [Oscillospiraceae bacterium]